MVHGDELRMVTVWSAVGLSGAGEHPRAANGGSIAERPSYLPELAIFGIAEERRHRIAAVVLGEVPVVVHHVIHDHGRRGMLGPASEDEVFDAEESRRFRSIIDPCAGPQVDVVAPGAELQKDFTDVRARDVPREERPLDVEKDVQGLF